MHFPRAFKLAPSNQSLKLKMPRKKMQRRKNKKKKMKDVSSSSHEKESSEEELEELFMSLCLPPEGVPIQPHFFIIIGNPSIQLKKLRLPPEFTKESGSTLSNYAYLRAPQGNEHRVDLMKQGGNIWFTGGWKDFAKLYSIADGHFLIFRYQGSSRFNVFIFNTTCCEICYPRFDTTTSDEDENWVAQEDEDDGDDDEEHVDDHGYACMPVSAALVRARELEHECSNPCFIVSMRPSYLGYECRMWIPQRHAKKYLNVDVKDFVELRREGGGRRTRWSVTINPGNHCFRFGRGWKKFSDENHLNVDDVCLFELVDRSEHVYMVHVVRADS